MLKQYVGFIRDHSLSMTSLSKAAMDDYNSLVRSFKSAAQGSSIDTIVSTVLCGVGPGKGRVEREIVNSNIQVLQPITYYPTNGYSTPLFDSVGELINLFKNVPDYLDKDVSFLIMVVTDGEDNDSLGWKMRIADEIRSLQGTDRWTFVFRVPRGYKRSLIGFGVPDGNIIEWDLTEESLKETGAFTEQATQSFYSLRSAGAASTSNFYANIGATKQEIRSTLQSISKEASVYPNVIGEAPIKDVAEHYMGKNNYKIGKVFYRLDTGRRNLLQTDKLICIQEKNTNNIYGGNAARSILGIPRDRPVKLSAGDHGNYDIFIQSKSVNRKIPANSKVLVWANPRNI